jgi:hypothetical protein
MANGYYFILRRVGEKTKQNYYSIFMENKKNTESSGKNFLAAEVRKISVAAAKFDRIFSYRSKSKRFARLLCQQRKEVV